jgi:putative pyruvate formate lyase activating enzyme
MELLQGVVDVHVADLKYGNDDCARKASGIAGYWNAVTANLERAAVDARLIVRHLLLPGHGDCCVIPLLHWLARRLPDVPLNLMAQYRPDHLVAGARRSALGRSVTGDEVAAAQGLATSLGLPLLERAL